MRDDEPRPENKARYARGSRASRVCARTSTHPRTGIPAGPVRTLAGLQGRCARWPGSLPGDPCAQLILLTPIAVPTNAISKVLLFVCVCVCV